MISPRAWKLEPRYLPLFLFIAGCRAVSGYGDVTFGKDKGDAARTDGGKGGSPDSGATPDVSVTAGNDASQQDAEADTADSPEQDVSTPELVAEAEPDVTEPADAGTDDALVDTGAPEDAGTEGGGDGASSGECAHELPDGGAGNLITNPDFEGTPPGAGWAAGQFGGAFAVSTTVTHCGTHSGSIINRAEFYHCFSYAIELPGGTSLSYSFWIYQDGEKDLGLGMQGLSASGCGTQFGSLQLFSVPPKQWTPMKGTLTTTAGCTTIALLIVQQEQSVKPASGSFPTLYVDDVWVAKK